ncbi:MAG: hypothetical protein ACFCU5_01285 [Pleurocapsa sp.]
MSATKPPPKPEAENTRRSLGLKSVIVSTALTIVSDIIEIDS